MHRRDLVARVMQDVARLEFDRLEVRREQFEVRAAEPLEKIVLGPTGHMSCSGRESAPARTLRFRDGADGSKVHTRVFSALEKMASRLRNSRKCWRGARRCRTQRPSTSRTLCKSAHSGARSGVASSSQSAAPRPLCPTPRPILKT